MRQKLVRISLMIIAPVAVFYNVYLIKTNNDNLPEIILSLIFNLAAVYLASWIFGRYRIDGHNLPEYIAQWQGYWIAKKLEQERLKREYYECNGKRF